jgi:hypothetical protein
MTTRHPKTVFGVSALVLLLGAALAGCLVQDSEAASGELYVKDNLTDEASEVYITFSKAEVLPAQAQAWETVFEGEETFEMLSLSGPNDKAKLSAFELQPGHYLHLRITITNVTVVYHDGNESYYPAFGNVVTIGHDLRVEPRGNFEVLVDFDLESGVDLAAKEYIPVIGYAQTTERGRDGTGNQTNRTERPAQSNAMDGNGIHGVCTAWKNAEKGRTHGNATNSTAFAWLQEQAATENGTIDGFCEEHARPGAPATLFEVLPDHMPEQARAALEDRHLGPPGETGRPADAGAGPGAAGQGRNETASPGGGPPQDHGPTGNQTGPGGPPS